MKNSFINGLKDGFISSFTSATITQPFQVVSTNMIVNAQRKTSLVAVVKNIYKNEGIFGFYRGFTAATLKNCIGSSVYFACLEHFTQLLKRNKKYKLNSLSINIISAAIARTCQVITVCPLNVIKTRFEVSGFNSYNNVIDAFRKIYHMEGFAGYFKGIKSMLIKEIPYSSAFYTTYEYSKRKVHAMLGIRNVQLNSAISSLIAVGLLTVITNPLEVIRTRLQYQFFSQNEEHNYKSIIHGIYLITKHEGVKGLTSGMLPVFLKKGTAGLLVWTLYDTLKTRTRKSHKTLL
jgi:hypothetical protein